MRNVQEIWHTERTDAAALLQAAAQACNFNNADECQIIMNFLDKRGIMPHHMPVHTMGNKTICTLYHHGNAYTAYVIGEPESVLHVSVLSENEREKVMLESRRLANGGATTFSVAHGTLPTVPKTVRGIQGLTFDGHISIV